MEKPGWGKQDSGSIFGRGADGKKGADWGGRKHGFAGLHLEAPGNRKMMVEEGMTGRVLG